MGCARFSGGDFQDPSRMADLGAALTSSEASQLQAVLEQLSIPERCARARARVFRPVRTITCRVGRLWRCAHNSSRVRSSRVVHDFPYVHTNVSMHTHPPAHNLPCIELFVLIAHPVPCRMSELIVATYPIRMDEFVQGFDQNKGLGQVCALPRGVCILLAVSRRCARNGCSILWDLLATPAALDVYSDAICVARHVCAGRCFSSLAME